MADIINGVTVSVLIMTNNDIELLCTLGPSSINERIINRLEGFGATLFRINLSHTKLEDVRETVRAISKYSTVPICLDTEGAQIRTGTIAGGAVTIPENHIITAHATPVEGGLDRFSFYPDRILEDIIEGDLITIDFNSVLAQVVSSNGETAELRILNGGQVGSNKAVTIQRQIDLPPLTAKDLAAVKIGREEGVIDFALSFANRPEDVDEIRNHAGDDARIISKIECQNGLINLDQIAARSDAVLIDRGDLSREIPIERIPQAQKLIIDGAKKAKCKVYVATNLLESMITSPTPTRAEISDIYNTLQDGVDGLVLAAETAIGDYPLACAAMVQKMAQEFRHPPDLDHLFQPSPSQSLLVAPHGGELVYRISKTVTVDDTKGMPAVALSDDLISDLEQIALGTYSPLKGFMDEEVLDLVSSKHQLPNGVPWTMPIVLPVNETSAKPLTTGTDVVLSDKDGSVRGILALSDIYRPDLDKLAQRWFNTDSKDHPRGRAVISPAYLNFSTNRSLRTPSVW